MKHYDDIRELSGAALDPVDCIIGGSPCQDLSLAGKHEGLSGSRSNLFFEQVRIVKEMRENEGKPRYMLWENVVGAFGTHKGADFQRVLTEIVRIADPEAPDVPMPSKKWDKSGILYDENGKWSIAWRTHDAQYWGVAQRRKRISLLADFDGLSAPRLVFDQYDGSADSTDQDTPSECTGNRNGSEVQPECEGLSGNPEPCGTPWEGVTTTVEGSTGETGESSLVYTLQGNGIGRSDNAGCGGRGWSDEGVSYTLNTVDRPAVVVIDDVECLPFDTTQITSPQNGNNPKFGDPCHPLAAGMHPPTVVVSSIENHPADSRCKIDESGTIQTLTKRMGTGGNNVPLIMIEMTSTKNTIIDDGTSPTLTARMGTGGNQVNAVFTQQAFGDYKECGVASALKERDYKDATDLVVSVDTRNIRESGDVSGALQAKNSGGYSLNFINPIRLGQSIRRLTPKECERLQGLPDNWTNIGDWIDDNGKKHKSSDSARYRALGNGIATPYWQWLIDRISAEYDRPATMGSLFDGIASFPYCWEKTNGSGTAIWSSEIEPFPKAVSKYHFPE